MAMIELTLENNVQQPVTLAVVDRVPWKAIKIGQSFAVTKEAFGNNAVVSLRQAISYRQKATSEKYSVRKMEDGSFRCWRTA